MFDRTRAAALRCGIDSTSWLLQQGSSVNGVSWGIENGPYGLNKLGRTPKLSYVVLLAYALAWEQVPYDPKVDLSR